MSQWNFEKPKLITKTRVLIIIALLIAVFFIVGCVNIQQPNTNKKCIDGHLYEVTPQKVELLKENGC